MAMSVSLHPVLYDRRRGHRRRVATLAAHLGRAAGLPLPSLAALRVAAWAHDIGKRGVPTAILDKPGPLDPEEVRITRRHVLIGADLAQVMGFSPDVIRAIRHHHERWDRTGYPDGLAGEAIPVFARIIAIADAYDAMTEERRYRVAVSADAALGEIAQCAGTQFDPHLTTIFINRVLPLWRSRRG